MSQSATLYRIAHTDFSGIVNDPEDFDLFKIQKGHETFQGTHEGLRFILSKDQETKIAGLINSIFEPATCIEAEADDTDPEADFYKEPILYHTQDRVKAIALFLAAISMEKFRAMFNPAELNERRIYPGGYWKFETDKRQGYNLEMITEDFSRLKDLFTTAAKEEEYVVSFVG